MGGIVSGLKLTIVRTRILVSIALAASPLFSLLGLVLLPASQVFVALEAIWLRNLLRSSFEGDLRNLIAGAALIGASRGFEAFRLVPATYIELTFAEKVGVVVNRRIARLVASVPHLGLHESPEARDQITLLQDPMTFPSVVFFSSNGLGILLAAAATFLILASIQPLLVVMPLLALPGLLVGGRMNQKLRDAESDAAPHRRLADHYVDLALTPSTNKEMRLFNSVRFLSEAQAQEMTAARALVTAAETRAAAARALTSALTNIAYAVTLVLVTYEFSRGSASVLDLFLTVLLVSRMSFLMQGLQELFRAAQQQVRAIDRLLWIEKHARGHRLDDAGLEPEPLMKVDGDIQLDRVSFRYGESLPDVLKDVSLTIPTGSTLALVGENGSGKTTLVKLLCGFYTPTSGRISVGHRELADFDINLWRRNLTASFQDFSRPELSTRYAVGLGNLRACLDGDDRILEVIDGVGKIGLSTALSKGLDTQLGASWPDGVDLSLGQWQRIALARAWMRESPKITILDEPTASLDAEIEHEIFQQAESRNRSLKANSSSITMIVSHRFSTVQMADRILVLQDGRIEESGSHEELMRKGGAYSELYSLHAAGYRDDPKAE